MSEICQLISWVIFVLHLKEKMFWLLAGNGQIHYILLYGFSKHIVSCMLLFGQVHKHAPLSFRVKIKKFTGTAQNHVKISRK